MARKELKITIGETSTSKGAESRDFGRTYLLTEMSASRAEKWAARAWLAIAHAGKEVPPEIAAAGMVGFALYTFAALSQAKYDDLEPLMDEMMGCVQYVMKDNTTRSLVENDIEEVDTRAMLRLEVLHLHTGFTISDWLSSYATETPEAVAQTDESTSTTQTSPA